MVEMLRKSYAAFLFDMDGTLISSTAVAERIYTRWAEAKGVDVQELLAILHGVRTIDVIRRLGRPDLDPETEANWIGAAERKELDGVLAIAGARDFLASLPPERWALVTSADRELMRVRMDAAGIPLPSVIVTAEDVTEGKPDPQGYELAARRLGVDPADCLVFEDAPAGIEAGERAGADVMVITATHSAPHGANHASIANYLGISLRRDRAGSMALVFDAAAE
jgi:sugar-phosphatase